MNDAAAFFRKYHAVPATGSGPQWSKVAESVLLEWFNRTRPIVVIGWNRELSREATVGERRGLASLYAELLAEVRRRRNLPNPSAEIVAANFISLVG